MAVLLASASTGVMNYLIGKLTKLLEDEYKLQKGVKGEIAFINTELGNIYAFLQDMDAVEEPNAMEKAWMKEVRELSYDIEDCVDDFMHNRESRWSLYPTIKARHDIAVEIQRLKARSVEAKERHGRYSDPAVATSGDPVPIDHRLPGFFAEAADLVGIDGPKGELVKLLTEGTEQLSKSGAWGRKLLPASWPTNGEIGTRVPLDLRAWGRQLVTAAKSLAEGEMGQEEGCPAAQLRVVSVVGCGGLGKTALAAQLYRHIRGQFECCAFVSVSRKPDLNSILSDMLSQADPRAKGKGLRDKELINTLLGHLRNRRYFVVIDDVWSISAWKNIKCALPKNNCGSRIIMTTRINDIAKSCSRIVYELKPLNGVNSKKLFSREIFGSEATLRGHLEEEFEQILNKYGGMPLAITSIASLLRSIPDTREEWMQIRNSLRYEIRNSGHLEGMKKILSLSYTDLPQHLKTCLLYLSIFPEHFTIARSRLVWVWIAEGFVSHEHGSSLYEAGESYFNELINTNIIQPADIRYDGRAMTCRVHDIVLNLMVSKSDEENFVTVRCTQDFTPVPQNKIRRLSVHHSDQEFTMEQTNRKILSDHVRSLIVFGHAKEMHDLSVFRALRVLDLENSENLENKHLKCIWELFQLKYLGLRNTSISQLPEQIGELQYLQTLDLRGSKVIELPARVVQLRQLMRLLAEKIKLPGRIGTMQGLQELSRVEVYKCSAKSVQELGNLTQLRILVLSWSLDAKDRDAETYRTNLISSLRKLGDLNLRALRVEDSSCPIDSLLDSWSPPYLLQKFEMGTNCYFSRIPKWMALLSHLTYLDIRVSRVGLEDLHILRELLSLLFLRIYLLVKAPEERLTIGREGFQCLKEFYFICDGMGLMFEAEAMLKLERLDLLFKARETQSQYGGFDFGIQHLSPSVKVHLGIYYSAMERSEVKAAEEAIREVASNHPNHPTLDIRRRRR